MAKVLVLKVSAGTAEFMDINRPTAGRRTRRWMSIVVTKARAKAAVARAMVRAIIIIIIIIIIHSMAKVGMARATTTIKAKERCTLYRLLGWRPRRTCGTYALDVVQPVEKDAREEGDRLFSSRTWARECEGAH